MSRLQTYLYRHFVAHSAVIIGVLMVLIWLTQSLRSFSLITAKGQGLLVLMAQAALLTPAPMRFVIGLCMAIGLARAFRALDKSRELHVIHASGRLRPIWGALAAFILTGWLLVFVLANWVDPWARRSVDSWNAEIAADLLARSLKPGSFIDVAKDVTISLQARRADGEIIGFFADDRRDPASRQTYVADSARIYRNANGFMLDMRSGVIETLSADGHYAEVAFTRYEVAFSDLTGTAGQSQAATEDSVTILLGSLVAGQVDQRALAEVSRRLEEGIRVASLCLLVAAFALFPRSGRSRFSLPLEALPFISFAERQLGGIAGLLGIQGDMRGATLIFWVAVVVIVLRWARPAFSLIGRRRT